MKAKFSPKNYWQPTPKKFRRIGDAILGVGMLIAGGGLLSFDSLTQLFTAKELKWIIGISIILAATGKFLTNFFKDDNCPDSTDRSQNSDT